MSATSSLNSPIEFEPRLGTQSFHLRGDLGYVIRTVYDAFGIAVSFDPSLPTQLPVQFDIDTVDYFHATQILAKMGRFFDLPLQPTSALIAMNQQERREALLPVVEETLSIPGRTQDQLIELANLARNIFDVKQVATGSTSGQIVLRGEEGVLKLVKEMYSDIMDRDCDVLLDVNLYELDSTNIRNIGLAALASASAIDVSSAATSLISSNQTLLKEAISSGTLTLTGSTYAQELEEVEYLVAAGVSGSGSFSGLLGTLGSYDGVPLLGISIASTTLNLLLDTTQVRTLDSLQLRASNGQAAIFRVGSRYPILTSLTTSTSSSTTAAALAAAGVSSAVIAQYGGTSSRTTPQIQFEDLGLTLKVIPQVLEDLEVRLALDLNLEAIGGTGIDSIPILNYRSLTSVVTVADGQATMLATLVGTNETKELTGVPDLNDLPGFQGTDRNTNGTRNELLITITPHVLNSGSMHVVSRRWVIPKALNEVALSPLSLP